jgi:carbonic anhydrase
MRVLKHLFVNNRAWAKGISQADPEFFPKLSRQQSPEYLWIGCSDSRVPANQIVGLLPGEMFVHRNIANVIWREDLNCLSVIQFAVDILKVKHIIVCGHYGCAGVWAAQRGDQIGLADQWLRHVRRVDQKYRARLASFSVESERCDRLAELNVIEQVYNVCRTEICRAAWKRGQELSAHGWIYGLQDGLLRDLNVTITRLNERLPVYEGAIAALFSPNAECSHAGR